MAEGYQYFNCVSALCLDNWYIHIKDGINEAEFVQMREQRDATLSMPRLIIPAVQVNIDAGHLPEPEDNGTRYLKVPINVLGE